MMDVQYHCTNKIYIGESIQEHDQDLSSKCESARVSVGIYRWRVGFIGEGTEAGGCWKVVYIKTNTGGLWKRPASWRPRVLWKRRRLWLWRALKHKQRSLNLTQEAILNCCRILRKGMVLSRQYFIKSVRQVRIESIKEI